MGTEMMNKVGGSRSLEGFNRRFNRERGTEVQHRDCIWGGGGGCPLRVGWGGVGGERVRKGWSEVGLTGSCTERLLWDSRPVLEGGVMFGALGPEGLCTKNGP